MAHSTKLLVAFGLLLSNAAHAGSGPSTIDCKSGTGRTQVKVSSLDFYHQAEQLRFTIDGKSIDLPGGLIVWQQRQNVVTVVANSAKGEFELFGKPKTFKGGHDQYGAVRYTFTAVVKGTDPRPDKSYSPPIEVFCKLNYEI